MAEKNLSNSTRAKPSLGNAAFFAIKGLKKDIEALTLKLQEVFKRMDTLEKNND